MEMLLKKLALLFLFLAPWCVRAQTVVPIVNGTVTIPAGTIVTGRPASFKVTLSTNVTSLTITGGVGGQIIWITYIQPGGNTVTYGSGVSTGCPVSNAAGSQVCEYVYDIGNNVWNGIAVTATAAGAASGDLSGSYPAPGVAKVNGGSLPASKPYVGTNAGGQIVDATPPLSKPYVGTNASGVIVDATPPLSKTIVGTNGSGTIVDATASTLTNPLSVVHNPASVTITGATPSVSGGNSFTTNNGGATTITNFTGGVDSQKITVNCGDANTTIAAGANIATFSGSNIGCVVNQAYEFTFYSSLSKWVQVGGGGGTPGGTSVQGQFNNSNTFGGSACVNLPTISSTSVNFDCDTHPKGPNPWLDVTRYGVRACTLNAAPCIPGDTANVVAGNTTITVSAAHYLNGDGVTLYNQGPTHSMTTPGAPTVTPSVNNVLTGTRMVSPGPAGATPYSYQVFAEDEHGGITAASTAGTTTTGAASLGAQTVNITSCTRSGQSVTCTTASPHGYAIGTAPQSVFISGGFDLTFSGWWTTSNVADSTHFTFSGGLDTRNGATTFTTGGTVTWWNCNHITWAAVTGAYRYWIVGRTAGSLTTIGVSWPNNNFTGAGTITEGVLSWDDFGSTLTGNFTIPTAYIPSIPPASPSRDNLTTTVVSGGGTTTLVLANAPGVTGSAALIALDSVPGILAAQSAAFGSGGTGLPIYFPGVQNPQTTGYPINSLLDLTTGFNTSLIVNGTLQLNNTVIFKNASKITGYSPVNTNSSFSFDSLPIIYVGLGAYPGIHITNGAGFRMEGVSVNANSNANNALLVVQDFGGANPGTFYNRVEFNSGAGNDINGIGLLVRGIPGQLSAQLTLRDTLILPGFPTLNGISATPSFLCADCALVYLDHVQVAHRGMYVGIDQTGGGVQSDGFYFQASVTPAITFASADGNTGSVASSQSVFNGQSTMDTSGSPLLFFGPGSSGTQLYLDHVGVTALGTQTITGFPGLIVGRSSIGSTQVLGSNSSTVGAGTACINDGFYSVAGTGCLFTPTFYSAMELGVAPTYSMFMDQVPGAAPTIALNGSGSLTGSFNYQVAPIWQNNSVGKATYASATIAASGNSILVSWTPTVGCKGYMFIRNGLTVAVPGGFVSGCSTSSFNDGGLAGGGSNPSNLWTQPAGGGPTMLMSGTQGITSAGPVYAPTLTLFNSTNGFTQSIFSSAVTGSHAYALPDAGGTLCLLDVNCMSAKQKNFYDNFNRAALNTGGPCFSGTCYTTGTLTGNIPNLVSNQIGYGPVASSSADAYTTSLTFSQYEYAQFVVTGDITQSIYDVFINVNAGLNYECQAANNFGSLTRIQRNGTIVASGTFALADGDVLRCESTPAPTGTLINLKRCAGGAMSSCTTEVTFTDTSPLAAGGIGFGLGLFTNTVTATLDDFSGGELAPSLAALDIEQVWTQPQHLPSLSVGNSTPGGVDALPFGDLAIGSSADFAGTAAPANPSTNYCRQYFNSSTGQMSFLNSAGVSCAPNGISNATFVIGTAAIAANTCTSASTVSMIGVATSTAFAFTPNADPSAVTGWGSTGGLVLVAWPTANTLNYRVCNQTGSSITPSASVTFNVSAK